MGSAGMRRISGCDERGYQPGGCFGQWQSPRLLSAPMGRLSITNGERRHVPAIKHFGALHPYCPTIGRNPGAIKGQSSPRPPTEVDGCLPECRLKPTKNEPAQAGFASCRPPIHWQGDRGCQIGIETAPAPISPIDRGGSAKRRGRPRCRPKQRGTQFQAPSKNYSCSSLPSRFHASSVTRVSRV